LASVIAAFTGAWYVLVSMVVFIHWGIQWTPGLPRRILWADALLAVAWYSVSALLFGTIKSCRERHGA
jgi:hypothetical protein